MTHISFRALVATMFLPVLLISSLHGQSTDEQLVKNIYPGAQIWFEKMSQKYPEAQLQNVSFYVSHYYHSGTGAIYWPEDRLQAINVAYTANTNQSALDGLFKEDEYVLLHEAAHVLKNHYAKGSVALALTAVAFAALNGYIAITAIANPAPTYFGWSQLSLAAIIGNSTIVATLFAYIQSQEREADNFANQHADKEALHAGDAYLNQCIQHDQQLADLTQNLVNASCSCHPSPINRKQALVAALASRFAHPAQIA